ncbi:MAG TPA: GAF domain-containing protein, partial [Candidatus Elarobacter sp.]|nr:GAF domain-containing protein [Candidatus Elarobacter sp.]
MGDADDLDVAHDDSAGEDPTGRIAASQVGSETTLAAIRAPSVTPDRWLPILQRVTEGIMAHLDLQDLLREVLTRIREAMAVDNAAVLLLSEDGTYLTVYAARGPEEIVTGKARVRMGRGVAGTIAARREPMIVDDLRRVEVENPLLRATVRSLLGVPLLAGEKLLGVIHVDSARRRRFTEDDLQLLQVVAERVSLAIEHAQLFAAERTARLQAEASAQKLRALQAISAVALEHVRLDDLLTSLLGRIQDTLDVDNVAILLPNETGRELALYSVQGPEEAVLGKTIVPFGEGVAGTIAATRRALIVENLAMVPVSNPFLREHFTSLLGVPLLAEGQLVGVIHVDTVRERRFTDGERELLETLAERIAVAIHRAKQYEGTRRERDEAERQVAELQETTDRMDEFLSIASHELRTPLTSLNMNLQLLASWLIDERGKRVEETQTEYLARAIAKVRPMVTRSRSSVYRLDRLVGDLLDASRIREGHLDLRMQRVDLATIVREVVDEYRQTYPART